MRDKRNHIYWSLQVPIYGSTSSRLLLFFFYFYYFRLLFCLFSFYTFSLYHLNFFLIFSPSLNIVSLLTLSYIHMVTYIMHIILSSSVFIHLFFSAAMTDMGDKINSKKIAKAAGCYVIPGYEGASVK